MKRMWTIIGVADVPQSFKWYQSLLGLPETAPAHDDFGQILDPDGTVLLCLHEWGVHEHPPLTSPDHAKPGNGLLLFFRVDNFDVALPRARALVSRLEEEPQIPVLELRSFRSEILTDITSRSVRSIYPNLSIEPDRLRFRMSEQCPFYPQKRTLILSLQMSALCQTAAPRG
jgi:catechol 2,3-dioxygenase-like lactoylglutathione lyase family enzyme